MRERQLALHVCDPTWFQGQKAFLASHRLADVAAPARPVTDVEESSALFLRGLGEAALPSQCGRLYLGNEFCPYLAWSLDETLSACELAVDCGFELTLVSGAVRESAFAAAVGQVRSVVERFGAVEVVANDWGFLASLASLGARPVAGRLLFRSKRLPRLSRTVLPDSLEPGLSDREVFDRQLREMSECPWDAPWERDAAARVGLVRADLEMTPQGLRADAEGLPLSLHLPFTFVTGGGACPVARFNRRGSLSVCSRRCRDTVIRPSFPVRTWNLVQVGQTVFMPSHSLAPHYLPLNRIDRLIVEPALPM